MKYRHQIQDIIYKDHLTTRLTNLLLHKLNMLEMRLIKGTRVRSPKEFPSKDWSRL